MGKIKAILWDVDGTLLNFEEAEKAAICTLFERFSLGVCSDEMLKRYSKINRKYWQMLERNEMTKPEILVGRFKEFFTSEGLPDVSVDFNNAYQIALGDTICFNDNAYELVSSLKGKVLQYVVTNGTKVAQEKKLLLSGLNDLMDGVFISEDIGIEKPNMGFFDAVFAEIGTFEKDEIIIIGDSLTSDMKGGNNAGILCCFYNPKGQEIPEDLTIQYDIRSLSEVPEILNL